MFCLMDVSSSMDETRKDLAKRFFTLLYLFLSASIRRWNWSSYGTPIRRRKSTGHLLHGTQAGSTKVVSALVKMHEIIGLRFPASHYNIFGAQASDGDSFGADSTDSSAYLLSKLLPFSRYFVYAEVATRRPGTDQPLVRLQRHRGRSFQHGGGAQREEVYRRSPSCSSASKWLSSMQNLARRFTGSEWTLEDLLAIEHICARHAERYGLDTYPNQLEVITSEQMLDCYVSSGLPVNYGHWSFGKHFFDRERQVIARGSMPWPTKSSSTPTRALPFSRRTIPLPCRRWSSRMPAMGTTVSPRATTYSNSGRSRTRCSTTCCSRAITSPTARSASVWTGRTDAGCAARAARPGVGQVQAPAQVGHAQGARRAGEAAVGGAGEHAPRGYFSVTRMRPARPAPKRCSRPILRKPALLHREARAEARALAARAGAHRAQDRAVLLPASARPR